MDNGKREAMVYKLNVEVWKGSALGSIFVVCGKEGEVLTMGETRFGNEISEMKKKSIESELSGLVLANVIARQ
jgi:hypothetical protein